VSLQSIANVCTASHVAVIPVCCNTLHLCAWTAIYILSNYSKPACHERPHWH